MDRERRISRSSSDSSSEIGAFVSSKAAAASGLRSRNGSNRITLAARYTWPVSKGNAYDPGCMVAAMTWFSSPGENGAFISRAAWSQGDRSGVSDAVRRSAFMSAADTRDSIA